jgi:hypothetical protein
MYRFSLLALVILSSTVALPAQDAGGIAAEARQSIAQRADQGVLHIDDHGAAFTVVQVDRDVAYLDGGKDRGLAVGTTLIIRRSGHYTTASGGEVKANIIVGILEVTSVSNLAAMCQIHARNREIRKGDIAWVSSQGKKRKQATPAVAAVTQPLQPPSSVSISQPSPQTSAPSGSLWTTPEQKPQTGVAPAPGLSIAERAQMATGSSAPSQPARPPNVSAATAPPANTPVPQPSPVTPSVAAAQPVAASATTQAPGTSAPATSAAPVSTSSTMAAAPASSAMTASLGNAPPVGSVAADAITTQAASGPTLPANVKTSFKIKYVAADAVYIEGGKDAGLVEGMTLQVARPPAPGAAAIDAGKSIAEVAVVSVSNTSAVCEIRSKTVDLQRGDVAMLSQADLDKLAQSTTLGATRKYPQVIAFSEGDPLDEEQREAVPKPKLPEINRARGRIGLDYTYIHSTGAATLNTTQIGGVVRVDMTRIGGTFWNLNGYWRGSMNTLTSSSSSQPQSVYDLVNRTYTLGLTYVNPGSSWTAGVGRLFLPWATSLDTFDGGYLGRRFGKHTIIGAFAGSSPDPTSFNYNPDLRTAGSFVAFEAGSFDGLRFTSTEGIAVSGIEWAENRQFLFNETGLFYKRFLSIYNATQADKQRLPSGGIEQGLGRSFSTLRLQPWKFISFDVNHNYFRDVPTFSTSLISTGLVDKFLFQGLSAGARLDLPGRIGLYSNFGQSSRSGDTHNSLNQLYGITLGRIWYTGIRADVRYSKFASSFGSGNYRALTLSRSFKDRLRLEVNAGKQTFMSTLAVPSDYKLLGSTMELNLGSHYFIETAFNVQRGLQQNYNQWITTMGYRFDTKRGR